MTVEQHGDICSRDSGLNLLFRTLQSFHFHQEKSNSHVRFAALGSDSENGIVTRRRKRRSGGRSGRQLRVCLSRRRDASQLTYRDGLGEARESIVETLGEWPRKGAAFGMSIAIVGYGYRQPGGLTTDESIDEFFRSRGTVRVPVGDRYGKKAAPVQNKWMAEGMNNNELASPFEGLILDNEEIFFDYTHFGIGKIEVRSARSD